MTHWIRGLLCRYDYLSSYLQDTHKLDMVAYTYNLSAGGGGRQAEPKPSLKRELLDQWETLPQKAGWSVIGEDNSCVCTRVENVLSKIEKSKYFWICYGQLSTAWRIKKTKAVCAHQNLIHSILLGWSHTAIGCKWHNKASLPSFKFLSTTRWLFFWKILWHLR